MSKHASPPMDENTRRYYLDVMGVQCWQLLEQGNENPNRSSNTDVTSANIITSSKPDLIGDIQHCDLCQLHRTRKQAVSGRGSQSAELMIVLLSPSAGDDASGIICDGEENELLRKMLSAINISIEDVYITSLLKCFVPEHHTISPSEVQSCDGFLKQQIESIKPKRLVILGETAIRCLLQKNLTLDEYRSMNNSEDFQLASLPLFVSYSPGELIQRPDNKRKAWADLQQLQSIIGRY